MGALILDDVTVHDRNRRKLIKSLTLELPAGSAHILIGESGSGKSIVCSAIAGTLPPDLSVTGRIILDGTDLTRLSAQERRATWAKKLFLIPQEPWSSLAQSRDALSQVADMPRLHSGLSRTSALAIARRRLEILGLSPLEDGAKRPSQLSGGMCQQLAVATALGAPAPLILVDEPTKGLDAHRRGEVVRTLRTLLDEGRSMLLVTHDLSIADQFGGHISVMHDGRIVENGRAEEILKSPRHWFTQSLVQASPRAWPRQTWNRGNKVAALEDVSVRAGCKGLLIAERLNIAIHEREVVGLVGPSGSGKTTIGDTLLKLKAPAGGRVLWSTSDERRKFQKLYQNPVAAFAPWRPISATLSDALVGAGKSRSSLRDEVEPLLQQVELNWSLLERKPSEVSGGELQRLSMVRALLCSPIFLFADEPTSRLDQLTQKKVMSFLIQNVAERALGMLLVSHDPNLVNSMTDEVTHI